MQLQITITEQELKNLIIHEFEKRLGGGAVRSGINQDRGQVKAELQKRVGGGGFQSNRSGRHLIRAYWCQLLDDYQARNK